METETTTGDDDSATTALLGRHSVPDNKEVLPNGTALANGDDPDVDDDVDEDDEVNDETTALTSSNKELVVDESKL